MICLVVATDIQKLSRPVTGGYDVGEIFYFIF